MAKRHIECPNCGGPVYFELEIDQHYGADADGNRGVRRIFVTDVSRPCDCAISDEDDQMLREAIVDEYEDRMSSTGRRAFP